MKKLFVLTFILVLFASCQSVPKNPYSVVGTWELVDTDIDMKSQSVVVDRILRTSFAAINTLGGGTDQFKGKITFTKDGRCIASKFSCDYTQYGTTLSLKQKLLNAAGVNTKFTINREYNELYLTYDAKDALAEFGVKLDEAALNNVEKANIVLIFRKK